MAVERLAEKGCRWLLPRRSLAGCIFAAILRDTRDLALAPHERINYFPAAPFCAISLFFEGQSIMATPWGADGAREAPRPLPSIVVSGPHGGPTVSLNPGPVHVMTIGLYPEAMRALLGVDIGRFRDCIAPAAAILPPPLLALCEAARNAGGATEAFELFQDGLAPLWQASRMQDNVTPRWLADWSHHLLQKAAVAGLGRSLRQIERRMKAWTGQSRRDLAAVARLEFAFAEVMTRLANDRENWAQVAAANGFSDQPHFVREVRRSTGFPPAQLRGRIKKEPAFWYYRLIGELY